MHKPPTHHHPTADQTQSWSETLFPPHRVMDLRLGKSRRRPRGKAAVAPTGGWPPDREVRSSPSSSVGRRGRQQGPGWEGWRKAPCVEAALSVLEEEKGSFQGLSGKIQRGQCSNLPFSWVSCPPAAPIHCHLTTTVPSHVGLNPLSTAQSPTESGTVQGFRVPKGGSSSISPMFPAMLCIRVEAQPGKWTGRKGWSTEEAPQPPWPQSGREGAC